MDYTYLFCAMLAFTILMVISALIVADRLDKKSNVSS